MQIGKVPAQSASTNCRGGIDAARPRSCRSHKLAYANSARPFPPQDVPMPRAKPASPLAGMSLLARPYPTTFPATPPVGSDCLIELNEQVRGCKLCRCWRKQRTQTVFGVGNPAARVVFFGEAPGADEDRQGEPFVGRAGQLLTKIIEACTLAARGRLYPERPQVPPAGQSQPRSRRNRKLPPVLRAAIRDSPARVHRLRRHRPGSGTPRNDRIRRQAPRPLSSLPRQQSPRHLSPVVPAAQSVGQEVCLGRHAAPAQRHGDSRSLGGLRSRRCQRRFPMLAASATFNKNSRPPRMAPDAAGGREFRE